MTSATRRTAEELVGGGWAATGPIEESVQDRSILLEPERSNAIAPVLILVILIAAIMLPEEMSFYLGNSG